MPFGSEQTDRRRGDIAMEISNGIVRLLKAHADRGPVECRTLIDDDLVLVVMRGGYSRLENTLFENGKFLDVRAMRHTFQDTMEGLFTEVIQQATGQEVTAFLSASHQRPDVQLEIFMLDGAHSSTSDGSADPAG